MRLLDLFCCEGGAAEGYRRAGFDVVGVDNVDQPRYPFPFTKRDALEVLRDIPLGSGTYAAIHASPPCQAYSRAFKHLAAPKEMLVDVVRRELDRIGLPYVIENVVGAPMPEQPTLDGRHGVVVCGTSLGLRVERHRLFESNVPLYGLPCRHRDLAMNPHNQAGRDRIYEEFGRQDPEVVWRREMGVEWMSKHGGRQAVPPAYTAFIGAQLMGRLEAREAA